MVEARPRAAADQVEAAARRLIEASRPLLLLGDEVFKADAAADAVALAEMLGVPIVTPNLPAFNYLSATHPLYLGTRVGGDRPYPYAGPDLIVQIGAREMRTNQVTPDIAAARYIAIGLETDMIGRTRGLDLAVVGEVKVTIRDLMDAIGALATKDRIARIRDERRAVVTAATAEARAARLAQARKVFDQTVIHPDQVGYEMEQALDTNALRVTENAPGLQGKHDFLSYGPGADQKQNIGHGGGSLGWGVGAAVGAKLAAPDRQVVLSIGDGSLMYSAGGFWSMARHSTPVLTIVWNNHNYQTVRNGAYRYNGRMTATGKFPGLYLGDPDIDFVKLAESQGVKGERVTSAADIGAALRKGTAETRAGQPYPIEFVVSRVGGGADSTWYQKVRPAVKGSPATVR
ncbi:MAG: thiamine pyrophosphate-dependent enzyme [Vicinamibacterales bacterium]